MKPIITIPHRTINIKYRKRKKINTSIPIMEVVQTNRFHHSFPIFLAARLHLPWQWPALHALLSWRTLTVHPHQEQALLPLPWEGLSLLLVDQTPLIFSSPGQVSPVAPIAVQQQPQKETLGALAVPTVVKPMPLFLSQAMPLKSDQGVGMTRLSVCISVRGQNAQKLMELLIT
jgi:hypothetical protein